MNDFKFGRLFSDGIPTLRKTDEERLLNLQHMSEDRYDFKSDEEKERFQILVAKVRISLRAH